MTQALLEGFDQAEIAFAIRAHQADQQIVGESAAVRRAHATKTRRITSNDKVGALLPAAIAPGESWHVLSSGDIDVLSILRHLLTGVDYFDRVLITTWHINREDLELIETWLDAGRIEAFDLIIDQRFQRLAPDEYQLALRLATTFGGSVTMCMNHSKVTLCSCAATDTWLTIESSANVNTNRRLEQSAIHNCRTLFDFYSEAFDGIRRRSQPDAA